jgi:hypothetical protein
LSGNILIDTSQVATDTIGYVATDTWGNTATNARTVIVEAATSSIPYDALMLEVYARSSQSARVYPFYRAARDKRFTSGSSFKA